MLADVPVVEGVSTSTCSPLAALKDVVYSTRFCNVDLFMFGMLILLFVDVLDDSDSMVLMISLSVAVLCSCDLMLLLLDCLWKKNAA